MNPEGSRFPERVNPGVHSAPTARWPGLPTTPIVGIQRVADQQIEPRDRRASRPRLSMAIDTSRSDSML